MFEELSPDSLLGEIEDCQREESRLIFRRLAAIAALLWHRTGEADDAPNDDPGYALITGFARTSAEVSAAMNTSPMTASQLVGHAEALDTRLPMVAQLLAEGKTDWRTVQLIITRTELVDGELMPQLDQSMAQRIIKWQCWSRRRIINAVDAAVRFVDPKAAKERRVTADNARHVSVVAQPNGMAQIRGALPAPAASVVDKRLSEMATSVCSHDSRTIAQRRADVLLALSEGRTLACDCNQADCSARVADEPPAPSGARFVINVIASQETVEGCSDQPGYLEGYGVIDAEQVRKLAESATLRLLAEPTVNDAEALRYQPSAALERWIRCRDLMCCFPGCDCPAWVADIDHTLPFDHARPSAGGLTIPGNLSCYCRQHHRLKTFHGGPGGWHDEQLPDGTVIWRSPTGRVYRSIPAGADLFPQMRPACVEPVPRKRNRRREKAARTALARRKLNALRPVNAEQRRVNRARRQEIDVRKWRNNMRRTLVALKGGKPSTSPWCGWVNEPLEDEHITADWVSPPPAPPNPGDDVPPF
ncbi:MAG TPA: DUF222 domain-containing protein [Mycobacterium sp.]|nr:DUF222 domain-containing protein [Mycobacterium sp.]